MSARLDAMIAPSGSQLQTYVHVGPYLTAGKHTRSCTNQQNLNSKYLFILTWMLNLALKKTRSSFYNYEL